MTVALAPLCPESEKAEHPWRVLRVQGNKEADVQALLMHNDVIAYTPLFKERRQWTHRKVTVQVPVFPNYVFAQFDLGRKRELREAIPYITDVVSFAGVPAIVEDSEIGRIRQIAAAEVPFTRWPNLIKGNPVRIVVGKMAGLEGILAELRGETHVAVNVEILGRSVSTVVDRAMVVAA